MFKMWKIGGKLHLTDSYCWGYLPKCIYELVSNSLHIYSSMWTWLYASPARSDSLPGVPLAFLTQACPPKGDTGWFKCPDACTLPRLPFSSQGCTDLCNTLFLPLSFPYLHLLFCNYSSWKPLQLSCQHLSPGWSSTRLFQEPIHLVAVTGQLRFAL